MPANTRWCRRSVILALTVSWRLRVSPVGPPTLAGTRRGGLAGSRLACKMGAVGCPFRRLRDPCRPVRAPRADPGPRRRDRRDRLGRRRRRALQLRRRVHHLPDGGQPGRRARLRLQPGRVAPGQHRRPLRSDPRCARVAVRARPDPAAVERDLLCVDARDRSDPAGPRRWRGGRGRRPARRRRRRTAVRREPAPVRDLRRRDAVPARARRRRVPRRAPRTPGAGRDPGRARGGHAARWRAGDRHRPGDDGRAPATAAVARRADRAGRPAAVPRPGLARLWVAPAVDAAGQAGAAGQRPVGHVPARPRRLAAPVPVGQQPAEPGVRAGDPADAVAVDGRRRVRRLAGARLRSRCWRGPPSSPAPTRCCGRRSTTGMRRRRSSACASSAAPASPGRSSGCSPGSPVGPSRAGRRSPPSS